MLEVIQIHSKDNVMVALTDLVTGSKIALENREIILKEDVSKGHKFAISDISKGQDVIKYGDPIGHGTEAILTGTWVHTHNTKTNLSGKLEYVYTPQKTSLPEVSEKSFEGYIRENGDVGIRNELWIVPTVGCVNGIGMSMLDQLRKTTDISHIDAVEIFKHNYGCSQLGEDHGNTQKILVDLVKHPNAGGILILGLGCENNQMDQMLEQLDGFPMDRVRTLVV